jgi:hypothetical protein
MARAQPYLTVGNKRVPSVTTITGRFKDSGALMWWANAVGRGERDCDDQEPCGTCGRRPGKETREAMGRAADVGTYAHALIDHFVKGTLYDTQDFDHLDLEQEAQAMDCMAAFQDWWDGSQVEVLETELRLVSETHLFGGQFDAIGRVNSKFALIDWKTSKGIYADYLAQLAGYVILVEEAGFPAIEETHIIRISKGTAGFEHRMLPRKSFQPAIDYFLQARALYDLVKPLEALLK